MNKSLTDSFYVWNAAIPEDVSYFLKMKRIVMMSEWIFGLLIVLVKLAAKFCIDDVSFLANLDQQSLYGF